MLFNGVRKAAIARGVQATDGQGGPSNGAVADEEKRMAVSMRESLSEVSDPRHLDASVDEVFRLMLSADCRRTECPGAPESDLVTAVVGFGGVLSGACVFRTGGAAAREIASRMTGMAFDEIDDTVKDGIGEICNMLAGVWKGKVPDLAARCGLSVPAVITGSDYKLHVQAPEFHLYHEYCFDGRSFSVSIVCDGLQ